MARVPIGGLTVRNFANAGLVAIGIDVSTGERTEEDLVKEFQKFVKEAEAIRLHAYVHGLNTFSLALAAITSGYRYIDGGAISSLAERPAAGYRLSLEDIYMPVLSKARE
jgi:hypothetical protein